jgi:DNA-binding transcriptional LysR family regulator
MKLSWEDAQTFLAVVEQQSFSAAARVLGLGQPTISRRIQSLEQQLSLQLFVRGKHGAIPTESALQLLPAAAQMARWAAELDRAAMGMENAAAGTVTIAAPPGIAVELLAPFAGWLKHQAPLLRLNILSAVEHMDLTRGEADLAVRTRAPAEPELVTLHREASVVRVYASAAYSQRIRQPCHWADLDWVTWSGRYRHVAPRPMLERLIPGFEPAFGADDYLVQKAATVAGLGAMVMGIVPDQARLGLVQIDVGVDLPDSEFFIVCAKSMQQVPRVVAVVGYLIDCLAVLRATGELPLPGATDPDDHKAKDAV